jgi:outer membrane immunogenic protein
MKKLNFLILTLILTVQIFAQDTKPAGATNTGAGAIKGRSGVYGGVNFSSIGGDSDSYSETLTGWQLGLMYCIYSTGGLFSCWVEPGYNAVGGKYSDTYGGYSLNGSVNLGYIMIPIIARFQTQMGLFGDIGVQPQILVSAKDKYNGDTFDFKDEVNGFDYGIPVGVGYEHKKKVGIGARYYFGLGNINKSSTDGKDHNKGFSIRLHFRF